MNNRVLRGLPLLLLSASCVLPERSAAPEVVTEAPAQPAPRPIAAPKPPPVSETLVATPRPQNTPPPASAVFASLAQSPEDRQRALECLTAAVYYEARSEPEEGQRAVAQVVLNRVRHPAFPNSVCGVVFQGANRSTGCQFSFTCDGALDRPREMAAWARAGKIAEAALDGAVDAAVGTSTHFHTAAVSPWWNRSLNLITSVGSHIFYGWRGRQGTPIAFRQPYAGDEQIGVDLDPRVAAPVGPGAVRERTVTVHRGAAAIQAAAEQVTRIEDAATGVRVHRGGSAVPPVLSGEAESFGVTVHRTII